MIHSIVKRIQSCKHTSHHGKGGACPDCANSAQLLAGLLTENAATFKAALAALLDAKDKAIVLTAKANGPTTLGRVLEADAAWETYNKLRAAFITRYGVLP